MEHDNLRKVLIADEVGLGKTVEVGLLIGELAQRQPGLKVLYLAPARLVPNVRREFDKLGLSFRQWTAADGDARLTDSKILASLHRAVHGRNFEKVIATGHWDVLVVDECHHLSAWNVGGGDPRESYRLVRELIARQRPGSRVILLSGTPHQGNMTRFENLLRLLRNENEPDGALGGRVIYRTKEDIRDWYNNRLFPPRKVNEETVIDLGPDYRAWIRAIHSFFRPQNSMDSNSTVRQRAAG
jgi:SNF2 family DNA or RNA helicase